MELKSWFSHKEKVYHDFLARNTFCEFLPVKLSLSFLKKKIIFGFYRYIIYIIASMAKGGFF